MKIVEVVIEKFRSVKKAKFNMHNITAIVGENNAGKTAVLRALNAVLNFQYEEEGFIKKSHQYAPRNNTHITIVFEDVPNKDIYIDKIYDGKLFLYFTYSYGDNRKKYQIINGREHINVDDDFLKQLTLDVRN